MIHMTILNTSNFYIMNVIHCHIREMAAFDLRPFFGEKSTFSVFVQLFVQD